MCMTTPQSMHVDMIIYLTRTLYHQTELRAFAPEKRRCAATSWAIAGLSSAPCTRKDCLHAESAQLCLNGTQRFSMLGASALQPMPLCQEASLPYTSQQAAGKQIVQSKRYVTPAWDRVFTMVLRFGSARHQRTSSVLALRIYEQTPPPVAHKARDTYMKDFHVRNAAVYGEISCSADTVRDRTLHERHHQPYMQSCPTGDPKGPLPRTLNPSPTEYH